MLSANWRKMEAKPNALQAIRMVMPVDASTGIISTRSPRTRLSPSSKRKLRSKHRARSELARPCPEGIMTVMRGHFLWEDAADEYAALVRAWWDGGYAAVDRQAGPDPAA